MLYFDNAATTKISKASLDSYINASECFFNPSSLYLGASEAKRTLENARSVFNKYFHTKNKSTFVFTGSASESNNAVLNSCITRKDKKYIFSAGEHSSIYETAKHYQSQGYNIIFIPLLKNGAVDTKKLYSEIDENVAFVSIIYVSNETGAINDIGEITNTVKNINPKVLVHTDGVQAVGKLAINLSKLNVDFFTLSAHKINGPKGVGALYIANPSIFKPLIYGGAQEMNMRAGTENLPGIIAFKTALEKLNIEDNSLKKQAIIDNLSGDYYLVSDNKCVDNIISLCFKSVRGETIQHMLETKDIIVGTGSACNSKARINRTLSLIVDKVYIEGAIRLSFDNTVTVEDCKMVAKELSNCVSEYIGRIKR